MEGTMKLTLVCEFFSPIQTNIYKFCCHQSPYGGALLLAILELPLQTTVVPLAHCRYQLFMHRKASAWAVGVMGYEVGTGRVWEGGEAQQHQFTPGTYPHSLPSPLLSLVL